MLCNGHKYCILSASQSIAGRPEGAMNSNPGARPITLVVKRKSQIADDIYMFELHSATGAELPPFTPGSHITVTTPSGQKRRYSLCNDNDERDRYVIAVKQEKSGRGG